MPVREIPPRLHVLLRPGVRHALVLRRGPTGRVATLGWDLQRDTFTRGQWLRGRIYGYRADLSPDGALWVYFAMNGHWQGEARGAWTAVARPPWLKALHLFPKGDCWHGGGLFDRRGKLWLNQGYGHDMPDGAKRVLGGEPPPDAGRFGGECPGVYFPRLIRDGWALHEPRPRGGPDTIERPFGRGFTLRKRFHGQINPPPGRGVYHETHDVVLPDGTLEPHPGWEWAEVDRNRLVWAEAGCLWACRADKHRLAEPERLHDFGDMAFERVTAPY